MKYKVRIYKKEAASEYSVKAGTNLLEFLQANSYSISSPCGGNGTCGKCRVKVKGIVEEPSDDEKKLLGMDAVKKGYRLSCCNYINSDIDIFMDESKEEANIVTTGKERTILLNPIVKKSFVQLDKPTLHDQLSDVQRVIEVSKTNDELNSIDIIKSIPDVVRKNDFKVTVVSARDELIAVEPGDTSKRFYGIAVDIGTTTIAAYLYNLVNGEKIDVFSLLNPQRRFGADVLSRIEYTMQSEASLNEMTEVLISAINSSVIDYFVSNNNIKHEDIYMCVFVGNTTMMHFLLNVSAKNIAVSPFIAVTTGLHILKTDELGLKINTHGRIIAIPSVAGYIGADTIAAVLSSGIYAQDKPSLLVDIGTNGEIVLGNSEWLYSCSTAAGPAFEGANIRNGVGGVTGAIDTVKLKEKVKFTTIGKGRPIGICGSGIVDAVAQMLLTGVIDETGRIVDEDEVEDEELAVVLRNRVINIDGAKAFLLLTAEETASDIDIAITQKDIREIQNAKAAIAAGVKTLVKRAGIRFEDVDKVYLAGGFGSYINIDSALKIGLIPSAFEGRVESIGNAAGQGAIEGLLSAEMLEETKSIKRKVKYIELSASADFTDEYVQSMIFD